MTAATSAAWQCSGRDEKTAPRPNQKTSIVSARWRTLQRPRTARIITSYRQAAFTACGDMGNAGRIQGVSSFRVSGLGFTPRQLCITLRVIFVQCADAIRRYASARVVPPTPHMTAASTRGPVSRPLPHRHAAASSSSPYPTSRNARPLIPRSPAAWISASSWPCVTHTSGAATSSIVMFSSSQSA